MQRTRRGVLVSLGTALTAGCSAPVGTGGDATSDGASGTTTRSTSTPGEAGANRAAPRGFTEVYRRIIPSVVLVRVYGGNGPSGEGSGFVYEVSGSGSGGRGAHVITNQHVVKDASTVRVQFRRGDWRKATVVGTDVYSDLAVLRVPNRPKYATPLRLIRGQPPVGTPVLVLGSPLGLGGSASAGIVSGQDRSLPAANGFTIADAVQTDAAVNPGNSGGPMVNTEGRVVGVVTAAGGENIGFAVSAALVRRVVPELVRDGKYDHSFMGVQVAPITPLLAEANGLRRARGVYIDSVKRGGPSAGTLQGSTGEKTVEGTAVPVGGDVVVSMNDRPIPTTAALSTFLALRTSPGDTISVTVVRDGERRTVELTLGSRPKP